MGATVLVIAALATTANAGGPQPRFSYTPAVVQPGQTISVSASQLSATSVAAVLALTSDTGQVRVLGFAPITNGTLAAQFTIPSNLSAGRYLVGLADQSLRGAANETGTLVVAPSSGPWFQFSPGQAAPGGTIRVSAAGYAPNATLALVGLVNHANQTTLLGVSPLTGGGFDQVFSLPFNLSYASSYRPFVMGPSQQLALPVSGPFSIAVPDVLARIPVGRYPVGVEVNPLTNRIYAGNAVDSTVSVIDGVSHQVVATVPTGDLPCAMAMNLATNRLYVANLNSDDVTVIDQANQAIATIPAGDAPCAVRVLPAINRIYVGNYRSNNISVIDGASHQIIATIPLSGPPYGLGVDTRSNRVYAATGISNSLAVIDGMTNSIVAQVPVGKAPDAVAVNPLNKRVYVANFFGDSLTVVDGVSNTAVATVRVGREPSGVAVNPVTGRIFVGNYGSHTVTVIEGLTNQISATIAVGQMPDGITVDPATARVYSVNSMTRDVTVIADPPSSLGGR